MAKDTYLRKILGGERLEKVKNTKILMVGAGGIGCELLKDLVLSAYGEIHIVDLDTITLSNLNRQFLFRHHDIDKSKSLTVAKAVEHFNYFGTKLVPHHGNIMDTKQFPIQWWDQFTFVFNALDNLEARRYVNKMCLFLKKPLMESGTTGFDGQIQPIYPYYSECFDCQAKVTPKTFPVCTIRSTPSQPVHCITWAKEFLFHQLFDETDNLSTLNDAAQIRSETDDKQEIENMTQEVNELIDLRNLIVASDSTTFFNELVQKIFKIDVERLLLIETLWKSRTKPTPLDLAEFRGPLDEILTSEDTVKSIFSNETKTWSTIENLVVLYQSSKALQDRIKLGSESFVPFDKDDEDTLDFVAASANLRSIIFNIDVKSKFDIKQIAGNIIPAIATTNAIISGFSSISGTNYFKYKPSADFSQIFKESSSIFISIKPNKYITSASLVGPNPECATSSIPRGLLKITKDEMNHNLRWLVELLAETFGYDEEGIAIILGKSRLIYDVDFDDNAEKKLGDIAGFVDGELVLVQDDTDQLENLELYITVVEKPTEHLADITVGPKKETGEKHDDTEAIVVEEDEDLVEVTEHEVVPAEPVPKKRKIT